MGLEPMGGEGSVVEVDETFIGRDKGVKPDHEKKGRGYAHKHKVLAFVDRKTVNRRRKMIPFTPPGSAFNFATPCLTGRRVAQMGCRGRDQLRLLKRQLSLPVSMMSQWWVSRSSSAVVILASPKTEAYSAKARLVMMVVRS